MLKDNQKISGLPRIGELFVEAGLVKQSTVTECLVIAKRAQLPLGRVLIMSGYVSAPDVDCAVQSQQMIKSGQVTRESAKRLVRMVHCNKITIEEAQARESFDRAFSLPFGQVGRLLFASQILSEEVLTSAMSRSSKEKAPLGDLLIREGAISQAVLIATLNCVIFIRDRKMTREQAAKVLHSLHAHGTDLPSALKEHDLEILIESETPRLLDLLHSASLIEESEIGRVLESALESGWQTGQILLLHTLINDTVLEGALQLQQMLAAGTLKLPKAIELINLIKDMDIPLETLLAELDTLNQVAEFLRRGQILNEGQIRQIAAEHADFDGSTLVREGVITHEMLIKGLRCLTYFRNAALTEQQAISAFKYSMQMKVTPEEAMMQINWDLNNRYGHEELLGKTA